METPSDQTPAAPLDVDLPGKKVHLVGTAHISQRSVDEVRSAVGGLAPDCVCVELDPQRLESLRNPDRWKDLDLVKALREGKGPFLLANLALSSFQRRMGLQTGVRPGAELLAAVTSAEERGAAVELVDRPLRTTLLRAWRRTGFWKRISLLSALIASAFEKPELGEEDLARLREKDTLSALLDEVGEALPAAKEILIDERDRYMAARIRSAPGRTIVAVVGAGHVPGLARELAREFPDEELRELESIPPPSAAARWFPWAIPGLVVALFAVGLLRGDPSKVADVAGAWALTTGSLSALGALAALAHPLAVLTAFVAAPFTTLHPALAAGMFSGAVQAWAGRPRVRDLENLLDELAHWKGWWTNRVSRVLLVFLFTNLGASAGTFLAFGWLKELL